MEAEQGTRFEVQAPPSPHSACLLKRLPSLRCGPCRQVFPHLSQIARAYAAKGLVVVSVSLEPNSPQLQNFVQQQGNNIAYAVRARKLLHAVSKQRPVCRVHNAT